MLSFFLQLPFANVFLWYNCICCWPNCPWTDFPISSFYYQREVARLGNLSKSLIWMLCRKIAHIWYSCQDRVALTTDVDSYMGFRNKIKQKLVIINWVKKRLWPSPLRLFSKVAPNYNNYYCWLYWSILDLWFSSVCRGSNPVFW